MASIRNVLAKYAEERAKRIIKNMKPDGKIDFSSMGLTSVPPLPEGVRELKIKGTHIRELPVLPDTLEVLELERNDELTSLPPLPPHLRVLKFPVCSVRELPSPLPPELEILDCGYNQLSELPELPPSLRELSCDGFRFSREDVHLTTLPRLPDGLQNLSCRGQWIQNLPLLPPSLVSLRCDESSLQALPVLPSTLRLLTSSGCQIQAIPHLPASLEYVDFRRNPLRAPYSQFWQRVMNRGFAESTYNPRFFFDPYMRPTLERFKQEVNEYYPIYITKKRGRNLAAFEQTMGRPGAKVVHTTPAGEVIERQIPHMLGQKYGPSQIIGSFLTGKPETQELDTQKAALIANLPTGGRRHVKSRRWRYRQKRKRTRKHT
jgi:hypothetical protein